LVRIAVVADCPKRLLLSARAKQVNAMRAGKGVARRMQREWLRMPGGGKRTMFTKSIPRSVVAATIMFLVACGSALADRDGRGGGGRGGGDRGGGGRGGDGGGVSRSFSGGGGGGRSSQSFSRGGEGSSRSFSRGGGSSFRSFSRGGDDSSRSYSRGSSRSFGDSGSSRSFSRSNDGESRTRSFDPSQFSRRSSDDGPQFRSYRGERPTFGESSRDAFRSGRSSEGTARRDFSRGPSTDAARRMEFDQARRDYQTRRPSEDQVRDFLQMRRDGESRDSAGQVQRDFRGRDGGRGQFGDRDFDGRDRDALRDRVVRDRDGDFRDRDRDDRGGPDYDRWRRDTWLGERGEGRDQRDWSGKWRDGDRFRVSDRIRNQWWRDRDWDDDHFPFAGRWWNDRDRHHRHWNWWDDYAHRHRHHDNFWWTWAVAPRLATWVHYGWPSYYYWDYGPGEYIYYDDGAIYVNGRWYQPAPVFYDRTVQLIEQAPQITAEEAVQLEWMPLGVFAVTRDGAAEPDVLVQLAVTQDGVIGGTAFNPKTEVSYPVEGIVEKETQRAVW
jgi:hypothetical protein